MAIKQRALRWSEEVDSEVAAWAEKWGLDVNTAVRFLVQVGLGVQFSAPPAPLAADPGYGRVTLDTTNLERAQEINKMYRDTYKALDPEKVYQSVVAIEKETERLVRADQAAIAEHYGVEPEVVEQAVKKVVGGLTAHRHRYTEEVKGTRHGVKGVEFADFACDCGDIKEQKARK